MQRTHSIPIFRLIVAAIFAGCAAVRAQTAAELPAKSTESSAEWIDPATGHRVVRFSTKPGTASLYFHQNAYFPDGKRMIIVTPEGLATLNWTTREIKLVVPGVRYRTSSSAGIEVGRKTPTVYYQRREDGKTVLYGTNVDTMKTRKIAIAPSGGEFGGVNADETLIVGKARAQVPGTAADANGRRRRGRSNWMVEFYTANIATGEVKTFFPMRESLNHHQCSPSDPDMILYCHEGNWHEVDRIWTIQTDGTNNRLMHTRTMPYEIAGHEFFGPDGKNIWYDLQTPRSEKFWLAAVNVYTGERIRYPIDRSVWGVHYNISRDGKLFCSEGGGPKSVANRAPLPDAKLLDPPKNGQWIYLLRPKNNPLKTIKVGGEDVKIGQFEVEKLVDLSKHDYDKRSGVEPNATFTPDGKWIIFRSRMQGALHVYGVEISKHGPTHSPESADQPES